MQRFHLLAIWLATIVVLAGCSETGDYRLHLIFVDAEAEASVSVVAVWVLQPGGHQCEELVLGEIEPRDMSVEVEQSIPYPPTGEIRLDRVPAGDMLFFAEGRTTEGGRILRGCVPTEVKGGVTVEVTVLLDWVCHPDPAGELPNNGIDDDCDGLTDNCSDDAICVDLNVCTSDFCFGEECRHTDFPEGLFCDDQDPCTIDDHCQDGACQGSAKDCSAYDGTCVVGVCDDQTGQCMAEAVEDGSDCSDGRFCTINDSCLAGVCQGENQTCDDSDTCTRDVCNDSIDECQNTLEPVPGAEGTQVPGSCENDLDDDCDGFTDLLDPNCVDCSEDSDCNDHNDCTEDTCVDVHCQNQVLQDGTSCSDGLFCTASDACLAGVCRGEERDCSHLDDTCMEGVCSEVAGECEARHMPDGTACQDDLFCTIGEACNGGKCQAFDRDCSDNDICTRDECNEGLDRCDHTLEPNPGAEGPPGDANCENGVDDDCDLLTDLEDGSCSGCADDGACDDDNSCTDDTCDVDGECHNDAVPDGTSCDDGMYCTDPDICTQGVCGGPARDCSDSDFCTLDECNEDDDNCQNTWLEQPEEPDVCQDGIDQNCDGMADECCLADGTFTVIALIDAGDGPFSVTTGDFNADQIPDLVIPDFNITTARVLLGNGTNGQADGTFSDPTILFTSVSPQYVATGDFNADHILDLAITNGSMVAGESLNIFLGSGTGGQGDGTFLAPINLGGVDESQNIRVADFNSDGISDLAVVDFIAGGIRIFLGQGSGGQGNGDFSGGLLYATDDGAYAIEVADFNADRILDLAVSNWQAKNFSILSGQGQDGRGDGTFGLAESYEVDPVLGPTDIALGDFNSDRIHDLVLSTFQETRIKVFLGDGSDGKGDGTFTPGEEYLLEGSGWSYVDVADLNGDGIHDLISVNTTGDDVFVIPGNGSNGRGDGTFDIAAMVGVGAGSRAPAIRDFNSDSILDLLVPYLEVDDARLFLGSGSGSRPDGTFAPRTDYSLSGPGEVIAAGDFNSDKIQDLAVYALSAVQPVVEIFLGNGSDGRGDGTFSSGGVFITGDATDLHALDLNQDGILDLVVVNKSDNSVGLLFGNGSNGRGDGTFQSMITYATDQGPRAVAPGDFNHDGITDLAVVSDITESISVMLGSLDGPEGYLPGARQSYPTGTDAYWICSADFNADTIVDLAVPNPIDATFSMFIGDGSGGVGTGRFLPKVDVATVGLPVSIVCGDFNSDGFDDVLTVGYLNGTLGVHPGQGDGTFGDRADYPITNYGMYALPADFDGDRILDLAMTDISNNTVQILVGGGQNGKADGSFRLLIEIPVDSSQAHLVAGDFNSDGIVDLAVPSENAGTFGILLGQGECLGP